jgi:hypothetical protein
MQRKLFLVGTVALFLMVAPAWSEAPFGSFGGTVTEGNSASGVIGLHGWALDDDGVNRVDIFVDGVIAGGAAYGKPRPGVAATFPGYPDSNAAGFAFLLDTTQYLNGGHVLSARVTSLAGEQVWLQEITLEFLNNTHLLVPFGAIERPERNAELGGGGVGLIGNCDLADSERRYTVVEGFVLDAGVEAGKDMGVGWVELLIDGSIYANSKTDCFFDDDLGGLTDCYGLRRLDIERLFPTLANAPQSGFRFVLDVGALIDFGWVRGQHVLTIRAGDISGQIANVDEIPVTFFCDEDTGNEASFGRIGFPSEGAVLSGTAVVTGWALDWEGVSRVDVYVDGGFAGTATYGQARPKVASSYPGYPNSAGPGYYMMLDTTAFPDGRHDLQVVVYDMLGEPGDSDTLIGEKSFFVNNDAP